METNRRWRENFTRTGCRDFVADSGLSQTINSGEIWRNGGWRRIRIGKCAVLPRVEGYNPSPCPSPPGRGNAVACSVRSFGSCTVDAKSLLLPHPLTDADTLRRKLAKASLRGEGQDEGRVRRHRSAYARTRGRRSGTGRKIRCRDFWPPLRRSM